MKLAIVSSRFPNPGPEAFLETELKGLRPYFESVCVVPVRESLFSWKTLAGALGAVRAHPRAILPLLATLLFARCSPAVRLKNLLIFPKALAISQRFEREGIDHIHAYWLSTPATVAFIASQLTGIPWSSSAHRWDIYENNLVFPKARTARFLRVISERGNRDLARMVARDDARKVTQISIGVEIPNAQTHPNSRFLRILCAANLVEQKGHFDLLDALAILANNDVQFRCDIVGRGPLRDALKERIAELHLRNRVFLRGYVDHERLLESLRRGDYDVAVLTSRSDGKARMEGIPVALIEAMAAGLPCVATASGSIPELLDDECGFVVPVGDSHALASAIAVLAERPDVRERLGQHGRERVIAHFNLERTGAALAETIRSA